MCACCKWADRFGTYDEATAFLSSAPLCAPVYFTCAGTKVFLLLSCLLLLSPQLACWRMVIRLVKAHSSLAIARPRFGLCDCQLLFEPLPLVTHSPNTLDNAC